MEAYNLVLANEWSVADFRANCCELEPLDVANDGHCGYRVLCEGLTGFEADDTDVQQLRRRFWHYLDGQASVDFPHISERTWTQAKERVFSGGKLPRPQEKLRPAGLEQWLSNDDLPWMAQMLQAIICVCDSATSEGWQTYIPASFVDPKDRPLIGLWHTPGHWMLMSMKKKGPLPPLAACCALWGRQGESCIREQAHIQFHRLGQVAVHRIPREGCGCYGSFSTFEEERQALDRADSVSSTATFLTALES